MARNSLGGFQSPEANLRIARNRLLPTVFCNASSISETPLLVPSWNSSAAILRDVLCQKRFGRLPRKVGDCDCCDNRVL